jgi:hypothetical protein
MVDPPHQTVLNSSSDGSQKFHDLGILHNNIQSLGNKLLACPVCLSSWLSKSAILCFSEHQFQRDHLIHINIDQYKLVDDFCRNTGKYGGSCIFALN